MILSRSIHVAANGRISFFSMANIPLYIYIFHCVYIYSNIYMYHILLNQFSVDSLLGYFHVLAVVNSAVNSAAMSTGVCASF